MTDEPASIDGMHWVIRLSLVERLLTPWEGMGDMANQQRAEAAVQIKTMMDEIEELRGMLEVANEMAEHYAQERDEARRELCYWWDYSKRRWKFRNGHKATPTAVEWADIIGWDCFKEKP